MSFIKLYKEVKDLGLAQLKEEYYKVNRELMGLRFLKQKWRKTPKDVEFKQSEFSRLRKKRAMILTRLNQLGFNGKQLRRG